jgi:hypothetical protein
LDRACYKLSNEYLFAKFGFINLWEIKFENSICNLFEINQTGGKIIKNESDRIRNELGPIPNKPERAGPKTFRGGDKNKRVLTGGVAWSAHLTFPESVSYRPIKI